MVRLRARASGEDVRQREDGGSAGGVVVGAVVVGVAGRVGGADAEVVEMRGQQDDLVGRGAAAQNADGVPGLFARHVLELREALLHPRGQRIRQRGLLQEGAVVTTGLKAE